MNGKLILVIILTLILGCYHVKTNGEENPDNINLLRARLIGKWGGPGEKGPVWKFSRDSIYYYERDCSYPYKLNGDTLNVKFPDRSSITVFGKISVTKDTLKLIQYDQRYQRNILVKGYRFKN